MATLLRCTCCQAELTAPQFFEGKPYGYTCISKVSGQKKTKIPYIACDSFTCDTMGYRHTVKCVIEGKKHTFITLGGDINTQTTRTYMQNGVLFVSKPTLEGK